MGYPIVLVVGSKACEEIPRVEVHINDNYYDLEMNLAIQEVAKYQKHKNSLLEQ